VRTPLAEIFETAIREYGRERESLRSIAESRYDTNVFPTVGQYDWFSGQALYCLVRHLKPESIVEISTSSGYSTLFAGMALRENRKGRVDTFEWNPRAAAAAARNFRRWGVGSFVRIHVGDAKKNVLRETGRNASILFLDSLHTEAFARWFIERFVLPAPPDSLFHMHDIMPPDARVRKSGGPPFPPDQPVGRLRRWKSRIRGRAPSDENLPSSRKNVFPPDADSPLPTYDGNETTEARFGNLLMEKISPREKIYCHHAADRFPELGPREYDPLAKGRLDRFGKPFEWNESLWAYCGPLAEAYSPARAR
jgi:hypothetical protein